MVVARYPPSYYLSQWQTPQSDPRQYFRPTRFCKLYAPSYWTPWRSYGRYFIEDYLPSLRVRNNSYWPTWRFHQHLDDLDIISKQRDDKFRRRNYIPIEWI